MEPMELEHLIGYTGEYRDTVKYLPASDQKYIFSLGAMLVQNSLNDPHDQQFFRGHDEEVTCFSFSYDGKYVASGQQGSEKRKENDAPILIWDIETGEIVSTLSGHTGKVIQVAFSPEDDNFLASIGEDNRLIIWNTSTEKIEGGSKSEKVAEFIRWSKVENFNPRRPKYRLTVGYSNQIFVCNWDYDLKSMQFILNKEKCTMPGSGKVGGFMRRYFSSYMDPEEDFCIAGTLTGDMVVLNVSSKTFRTTFQATSNGVHSINRCEDITLIGSGDGTLKKFKGSDQKWSQQDETRLEGKLVSLSVSSDQTNILAGTSAGNIYLVNSQSLEFRKLSVSHVRSISAVNFGEKSEEFCTTSYDGTVRRWNLEDYSNISFSPGPTAALCICYQDDKVISGWNDGFIRCYDRSGKLAWQIVNAHRGSVVRIDANDKFITSGGEDGFVRFWLGTTRELLTQTSDNGNSITGLTIDNNTPNLIHACTKRRTLFTFDLKYERVAAHHVGKGGKFMNLCQKKDGEREILVGGADGKITFWDIDYAEPVKEIVVTDRVPIHSLKISPESGKFLAIGGGDAIFRVLDLESESVIAKGICHSTPIQSVAWSTDEKQLVSVGQDGAICVWNFYV
eukprot:gb/GECH01013320.1/.p1 GENE.gb/GECH01013320.1/~~gb/GECH01013320.1/.p1  ORF type:complete len:620 (+),score=110.05 gb/GECH01013320.1/:1-1860(+)